jgi:hypothetical protein
MYIYVYIFIYIYIYIYIIYIYIHIYTVEQFREGRLDYDFYMHFHGHNAYPAAFMYTYTALLSLTRGDIRCFQLVWAAIEVSFDTIVGLFSHYSSVFSLCGLLLRSLLTLE